jgi:prepilin-type N-terminal cleavage/methylation domain-containing protein
MIKKIKNTHYKYYGSSLKKQTGFTILEMLLALSVLSVGIMATFTLSLANLNTAKDNYQRILAANLAREGLEIVRNIRDSNWLKMEKNLADCDGDGHDPRPCTWDFGLDVEIAQVDYLSVGLLTPMYDVADAEECFFKEQCRLGLAVDNTYNHQPDGVESNFARLVLLQAICFDNSILEYSDGPVKISADLTCVEGNFKEKIGIRVTSQVYWQTAGQGHTVEVVEDLYNWREYAN